jgi:hypothetical protein
MSWYNVSQNRCASMSACSPGMSASGSGCNKPRCAQVAGLIGPKADLGVRGHARDSRREESSAHGFEYGTYKSSTVLVPTEE